MAHSSIPSTSQNDPGARGSMQRILVVNDDMSAADSLARSEERRVGKEC